MLTRLRALSTRLLYCGDINADIKGRIRNTLLKLESNGLEERTAKIIGFYLNHLAAEADLQNPKSLVSLHGTPKKRYEIHLIAS